MLCCLHVLSRSAYAVRKWMLYVPKEYVVVSVRVRDRPVSFGMTGGERDMVDHAIIARET
jgi:hypothetical protein